MGLFCDTHLQLMSLQLKISIAPEKHLLNSNAQIPCNGITDHRCDTAAQTHTVLCPHYSLSEVGAVRSRPRPAQLTARQHRRARSPPPPHSTPQRGGLAVVLGGRGVPSCHGAVLCCAVGAACPVPGAGFHTGRFFTPVFSSTTAYRADSFISRALFLSLPFSCSCSHQESPYLCPFCPASPKHFSC